MKYQKPGQSNKIVKQDWNELLFHRTFWSNILLSLGIKVKISASSAF